ncbi:MAG: hypothetical protein FWD71_11380 [Oscillospiraceae bacterium]|nr:hypothetical protein [Oscillospiraceae bacterium]
MNEKLFKNLSNGRYDPEEGHNYLFDTTTYRTDEKIKKLKKRIRKLEKELKKTKKHTKKKGHKKSDKKKSKKGHENAQYRVKKIKKGKMDKRVKGYIGEKILTALNDPKFIKQIMEDTKDGEK